ncbi:3-hydroxyisobutyrate dehydrogenase [Ahrensia sp. R2A130]|uniref:3-hydroxyisobutyrate dehydrogenase n=1 Tax=Ahrensia sp. R2A130 TaxID=744979 RepID=UPI0001E0AC70|nr:3-hydroxyisobutyrate dehydrogenase [Ahrensia sp. R2A130]EFL90693.1 3-hydroxyisobutyrate dehydrogenase [Ahrensia sp. R2A130]
MSLKIAFIGLGNMGGPMAENLAKAGHAVTAFDLNEAVVATAEHGGCGTAANAVEAADGAEVIITMLPAGKHVVSVYEEVEDKIARGTLMIDCSTIDIESAKRAHEIAAGQDAHSVDAPVSGGIMGAKNATLTFMAGGSDAALDAATPVLDVMGAKMVRCGGASAGQAAKVCNNMILAITMIGTCEAFEMGRRLGLEDQALFDVVSTASGQSWSTTTYCPVPGPVPTSPANNGYAPGFAASLMSKDLGLAAQAAETTGASTPLGTHARALYDTFCKNGGADTDFSGIIEMLRKV